MIVGTLPVGTRVRLRRAVDRYPFDKRLKGQP